MILAPQLALCLLAAALCILQAQGAFNFAQDCCESTRDTPLTHRMQRQIVHYEIQDLHGGCSIRAIVLITSKGRGLCYSPESKMAKNIMKVLDEKKARKLKKPIA